MLRAGFISDIHVDVNADVCGDSSPVALLARAVRQAGLDLLVIAGDISGDYRRSLETVDRLQDASGAKVLFVPGNHDLWNTYHRSMDAKRIYDTLLEHPGNLARGPVGLGPDWVIAGDTGWYDYAFGDPAFSADEFDAMRLGRRMWQDKVRAVWDRSAPEVHRFFMERLRAALDSVAGEENKQPKHLVFVTHVVQSRDFILPPYWKSWHYFNAFLGSPDYGELAVERGAAISVFGHVHLRKRSLQGLTEFICPCLGYARQWRDPSDPEKEMAEALVVRELG